MLHHPHVSADRISRTPLVAILHTGYELLRLDFQNLYRLSLLGYFWSFFKPLATVLPLMLVGREFGLLPKGFGCSHASFLLVGALFWEFFVDCIHQTLALARRYRKEMLLRPGFEWSIVSAGLTTSFFSFAFRAAIVLGWILATERVNFLGFFASILMLIPLAAMAMFIALPSICFNFVYNDLKYMLGYLTSLLVWSAAVYYWPSEDGRLFQVIKYNPITYLIGITRELIFFTPPTFLDGPGLEISIAVAFVLGSLGILYFRQTVRRSIDYVI